MEYMNLYIKTPSHKILIRQVSFHVRKKFDMNHVKRWSRVKYVDGDIDINGEEIK